MKRTQCEIIIDYMTQFGSIEIKSQKNRYGEITHYSVYRLADRG